MRDRPNFPRMTKTELLLMQTRQKGIKQVRGYFLDIKQYNEPLSVQDRRRLRFLAKKKYFKDRGISGY